MQDACSNKQIIGNKASSVKKGYRFKIYGYGNRYESANISWVLKTDVFKQYKSHAHVQYVALKAVLWTT